MRLKITLLLFMNLLFAYQVGAQCSGVDFEERNGIAIIEMEAKSAGSWNNEARSGASGGRALAYRGSNFFSTPGNSTINYSLRVTSPGTYRFIWRSSIGVIDPAQPTTEHNDSWLKITGGNVLFFGAKGNQNGRRVYPGGSGRFPNPNGTSSGGWFKLNTNRIAFNWDTFTSDNDGHLIYATFPSAGTYTVQVSGRSNGHIIDRMVLYNENIYSGSQAQSLSRAQTNCSGGTPPPPPPPTPPTPPTPPANNVAPTVSFNNLTNGQQVAVGSTVSVGLSSSDSDGSVIRHQVYVNGTLVDTDGASYTPHPISIQSGNYTIRAVVTDNNGATGESTISISAGNGTTPPPPPPPTGGNAAPSVSFSNPSNGQQVAVGSTVSVRLSASDSDGSVVKHQIYVNGTLVDTDGASFTPHPIRNIQSGSYSIRAVVTDNDGATSESVVSISAGSGTPPPPPPPTSSQISFSLINASTNGTIGAISNGTTFNSAQGINIRAIAPSNANSVRMTMSGRQFISRIENVAPYALYGDINGNYLASNLASGSYTIRAVAYSGNGGSGSIVADTSVSFSVGGISAVSSKAPFAYPNPVKADGRVSIKLPNGGSGAYRYIVSNSSGVVLENGQFNADQSSTDVDLELSQVGRRGEGVYYMTLISSDSRQTIPIIRE